MHHPPPARSRATWRSAALLIVAAALAASQLTSAAQDFSQHASSTIKHKYPASTLMFPSRESAHLEPIQGFRIEHEDNLHWHQSHAMGTLSAHDHSLHSTNAARSLGAHSTKARTHQGLHQPFPAQIDHVSFHAWGRQITLPTLHLLHDLYGPSSQTEVHDPATGRTYRVPNVLQSYHGSDASSGIEASVTVQDDGLLHGLIQWYDPSGRLLETMEVQPVSAHQGLTDSAVFEQLHEAAPHGMVAFLHSELTSEANAKQCGSSAAPADDAAEGGAADHQVHTEPVPSAHQLSTMASTPATDGVAPHRRRLLQTTPIGSGVTRWTNCYPGDTQLHQVSVGVAADASYYSIYGDVAKTQAAISAAYANANLVYGANFNVNAQLIDVVIRTSSGSESWNSACSSSGSITNRLDQFTSWRNSAQTKKNALWMLASNCFRSGTVGYAWIGVLCSSSRSTALSSHTSTFWKLLAHEMGHNFGGNHAFQLGQGKTGGIMDYGNGQYPLNSGIYQFHPTYNQREMCSHMTNKLGLTNTGVTPYCGRVATGSTTPTTPAIQCGNGIKEAGEECDDKSTCCVSCKLKTGAVCSPGTNGENLCCDSTCRFKPSSTSCGLKSSTGVFQSYCANGVCTPSVCSSYTGLAFCGVVEAEPCRQQCLYQGSCSDTLTNPSKTTRAMANGVVCKTSPYSTCKAGVCTAAETGTTGNTWVVSNPSLCSCAGTQTVSVACQNPDGTVLSADQCTGTAPPTTRSCTAPTSCATWKQLGFGTCSVDCGSGGVQTQTVQCVQTGTEAVVADSVCTSTKPASSRACTNQPKCPTSWYQSGFGQCTLSCGGGVQTQTVKCMQTQNQVQTAVVASACNTTAPVSSKPCNTQSCGTKVWQYGVFGACSTACGAGTQTRSARCISNSVEVDSSVCTTALGAPVTSQPCTGDACSHYEWHTGDFGTCSATCGGGTQTRKVQCFDPKTDPTAQKPVDNGMCIMKMPASMQSCNTQACEVATVYRWYASRWGQCSASCRRGSTGAGTATRRVVCVDSKRINRAVEDSNCSGAGTKPPTSRSCRNNRCSRYAFVDYPWSSCSQPCGGGTQTRQRACQDDTTLSTVDSSFCGTEETQSQETQACNTEACPASSSFWSAGAWSPCSVACGGGIRTRAVTCKNEAGVVGNDQCSGAGAAPASQESCGTAACGTYWHTGSWTQCSASCGAIGGTQSRTVSCLHIGDDPATATALADTECTNTKPSLEVECNRVPCPTFQADEDWGPCSVRCGQGTQSRNVTCITYDGRELENSLCAGSPLPVQERVCDSLPCPHWHRDAWTPCSQPCGGGYQNRSLGCRLPHEEPWLGMLASDASLCPPPGVGDSGDGVGQPGVTAGMPSVYQQCNIAACPAFYWKLAPFSACSTTCGAGTMHSTAQCVNDLTKEVVSDSLCLDTRPETIVSCNTENPCPTFKWAADPWGACQSFCGMSTQKRELKCENVNPSVGMHLPAIQVASHYCVDAGLAIPESTQPCLVNPESVCWGSDFSRTGVKNGRCEPQRGGCVCRSGTVGESCNEQGLLASVDTNGDEFVDGIPMGELLLIQWNSTLSALPRVHILLTKNLTSLPASSPRLGAHWHNGLYLASNVRNSGFFQWTVGEQVHEAMEAGTGYRVVVWFSKNLFARSEPFAISDPCAYKSCGLNGRCERGNCTCSPGFTGDQCQTGPCERADCNPDGSSCSNAEVITSPASAPVCKCKDGFTGSMCRTPAACAAQITCLNGGDFDTDSGTVSSAGCDGPCRCTKGWTGNNCGTCGLQCAHGAPNADCSACVCEDGWTGDECSCKFARITMPLVMDWQSAQLSTDPRARSRFHRAIEGDMETAARSRASATQAVATVESSSFGPEPKQVRTVVRFGPKCESNSGFGGFAAAAAGFEIDAAAPATHDKHNGETHEGGGSGAALPHSPSAMLPNLEVPDIETILSTYNLLFPLFSDTDSALWNGQVLQYLSPSAAVTAADPTGQVLLPQPSKAADCFNTVCAAASSDPNASPRGGSGEGDDGQPLWAWIVIGVSAGIVFLALLWCAIYMRRRYVARRIAQYETEKRILGSLQMQAGRV